MTPVEVGYLGIGVLFVVMFLGMPIGFGMGLVAFLGFAYIRGLDPALSLLGIEAFKTVHSYDYATAALFVLMGNLCYHAAISQDLYAAFNKVLASLRGGLAIATAAACAGFAAVSGSSIATAVTMGTVALPEMKRYSYDSGLATGVVAAAGTMGVLIPPSVVFVIYGIITEQSIGKLFIAGIIPGVIEAILYIIAVMIMCRINPLLAPPGPRSSFKEKLVAVRNTWIVVALFLFVIGGLYFGIFSATEAGGIGAFGAFLFALGRRKLTLRNLESSLRDTVKVGGMVFAIIIGAMIFKDFLAVSRIPSELSAMIVGLGLNRYVFMVLVILLYLVLGMFLTGTAMILLTMPILFPIIINLGFDPIWFGVIMVAMTEVGAITPPVGLNVFVIQGVAKDVPLYTVFRGIIPFLLADFTRITLYVIFPSLSLFLPSLMK